MVPCSNVYVLSVLNIGRKFRLLGYKLVIQYINYKGGKWYV